MRTALIGGASQGLGYACALGLASRGHGVVLCARGAAGLDAAARAIASRTGVQATAIPCDLSDGDSIRALGAALADRGIAIDILVNNVGGPRPGLVSELREEDWERGLDLLFRSTLRLYALVLPGMRRNKWGRIVNILSTAAVEPVPTLAISSVLRAALAVYAKLLSREAGGDGITIHSLMPGGIRTARTEELWKDIAAREGIPLAEVQARSAARIPIGRMLDAGDIGNLVAFLASEEAGGLTGMLLPVDGGQMITV